MMDVAIDRKAESQWARKQWAILALIANEHIVAYRPLSITSLEMCEHRSFGGIFHELYQSTPAEVVVLASKINDGLSLHIGLASKDEDLNRFGRLCGTRCKYDADEKQCTPMKNSPINNGYHVGLCTFVMIRSSEID
jgi:hypothetical protein